MQMPFEWAWKPERMSLRAFLRQRYDNNAYVKLGVWRPTEGRWRSNSPRRRARRSARCAPLPLTRMGIVRFTDTGEAATRRLPCWSRVGSTTRDRCDIHNTLFNDDSNKTVPQTWRARHHVPPELTAMHTLYVCAHGCVKHIYSGVGE